MCTVYHSSLEHLSYCETTPEETPETRVAYVTVQEKYQGHSRLAISVSLSVQAHSSLSGLFYMEIVIFGFYFICVKGPVCQYSVFSGFIFVFLQTVESNMFGLQ